MNNVCFIQPLIADYCIPLFTELGKRWHLTVIYSSVSEQEGFGNRTGAPIPGVSCHALRTVSPFGTRFGMYQLGLIRTLRQLHPDAVITFANLRYLSFWTTLVWCRLRGVPVFLHGHGVYKKLSPGIFWRVTYRLMFHFVASYISYTLSVAESLRQLGLPLAKISVAENSLTNPYCVLPEEKTGIEHGILFIGRLRAGCHLDLLIDAVKAVHGAGHPEVTLDVIGDGPRAHHFHQLAAEFPWIRVHGAVYDYGKISQISRECMFGCYPGNAGLSVVHLMSLSLPPITHDNLRAHQGPEPSYIKSGENGLLFDHGDGKSGLSSTLMYMIEHPAQLRKMQIAAYATYRRLTEPSLAERFVKIVGE